MIHTVKCFGIVNNAEVDVFLELSCFFYDPTDIGNLISGSSAFSKSSLNIWKFSVHILLKPGLENFEHYFASTGDECNYVVVWTLFGIAFLWDLDESWHFPVLWPQLNFPNLLAYWVKHFHASSFRTWNTSTGISSPPLALLRVLLPKAHLTLPPRCLALCEWSHNHCIWVIMIFFWCSTMYSCYLFLISSASVGPYHFCALLWPYLY